MSDLEDQSEQETFLDGMSLGPGLVRGPKVNVIQ